MTAVIASTESFTDGPTLDRFVDVLRRVAYRGWTFRVGIANGGVPFLRVEFTADGVIQKGRKWLLSPHMTNSEIIQTAFKAVLAAEEHEAREKFTLDGVTVLAPHFNLTQIAELVNSGLLEEDGRT